MDAKPVNKNMFASDNYSGICPTAWQAMEVANSQFVNSYGDDKWTAKACDALSCAQLLEEELLSVPAIKLVHPVQSNAVFVQLPQSLVDTLQDNGWYFHTFIGSGHVRFMCSWQTSIDDIKTFGEELRTLAQTGK